MVPQEFLRTVAAQAGISDNELEVMARAIQGEPMPLISKRLGVRQDALQKRLGEVYRKLNISGAGPGKLAKLQQRLLSEYQQQIAVANQQVSTTQADSKLSGKKRLLGSEHDRIRVSIDWGDAPVLGKFWGRQEQLNTLEREFLQERSRLVLLQGMGGIGKTALAIKLVQKTASAFDQVVWRSLRSKPTLSALLSALHPDHPEIADESGQIDEVIKTLSKSRCLIVLDEVESLFIDQPNEGLIKTYEKLFKSLHKSSHQSCLLLIGWGFPKSWESLSDKTLELKGLPQDDAQHVFLSDQLFAETEHSFFSEFIDLCAGNPLLLKLWATKVPNFWIESLTKLMKQITSLIEGILRQLLPTDEELSAIEQHLMGWLAVNPKPATMNDLVTVVIESDLLSLSDPLKEVEIALDSLTERSLLEISNTEPHTYRLSAELRQKIGYQLIGKFFNEQGYKDYLEADLKSAQSNLLLAIRYSPNLTAAHYNLGSTYEKLALFSQAREQYQMAMEAQTNRAAHAAINNLARLDILEGKIEAAIAQLEQTLPDVKDKRIKAAVHKNLGWAYFLNNQPKEAEMQFRHSLELDANNPAVYYLLAQVLEIQNRQKQAIAFWKTALELDEADQQANGVNSRLPELLGWRMMARQRLQKVS